MKKILAVMAIGFLCYGWAGSGGGAGSDTTAIHDDTASEISAIETVGAVASGDWLIIEDADDSSNKKKVAVSNVSGAGGAPTDVDYLVGQADATLSAEIVVGTTPGGELGGTWGSPTIDNGLTVANWIFTGASDVASANIALGDGVVNSTTISSNIAGTDTSIVFTSDAAVYDGAFTADSFSSTAVAGVPGISFFKKAAGTSQLGTALSTAGTTAVSTVFAYYGYDEMLLDDGMVFTVKGAPAYVDYGTGFDNILTANITSSFNGMIEGLSITANYTMPITKTLNNTTVYFGGTGLATINLPAIALATKYGKAQPEFHLLKESTKLVIIDPDPNDNIVINNTRIGVGDRLSSSLEEGCELDCQGSTYTNRWYCVAIGCTWNDLGP